MQVMKTVTEKDVIVEESLHNIEQLSLITPSRLLFARDEIDSVEYKYRDGRTVEYRVIGRS